MSDIFWLSLEDLKRLVWHSRKKLLSFGLLTGGIVFCFLLVKEPKFVATGTFKQGTGKVEANFDLTHIFRTMTNQNIESSTISIMFSDTLIKRSIEELGWQAFVPSSKVANTFSAIFDNLALEFGLSIRDSDSFFFKSIKYDGEKPLHLYFCFSGEGAFEVFDSDKTLLTTAELRKDVSLSKTQFTIDKTPKDLKIGKFYPLTLLPWKGVVDHVRKNFSIKPTQLDKNILKLSYRHRNRHLAAAFINQIIFCYQDYLHEETQAVADTQLQYLEHRQDELNAKLDKTLDEHVSYLKKAFGSQGFIGLDQEIEMLSQPQEFYSSKLFDADFELARLERMPPGPGDPSLAIDLSGIDSVAAKDLYLEHSTLLDSLQATLKELLFLHDKTADPNFDLSSLSNILTDPITQEMVQKAATLELELHDEFNRSEKEQERIRESLITQKKYIASHIAQSIDLHKIRLELTKNKLSSLQQFMIDLLKNEKQVIEKKLLDLKEKMADFPEKWRLENKLKLKTELTKGVMEGLTQITESKNLNRHLYHIESRIIDPAFPPLQAAAPYVFLFSLSSAFGGSLATLFYTLFRGIIKGLPVSLENLEFLNEPIGGKLSLNSDVPLATISDEDLETTRKVVSFLLEGKKSSVALLGKPTHFATTLAEALSLHHKKSLLINCDFDRVVTFEETPGLWHYLTDEIELPPIRKGRDFDTLPSGARSRCSTELLAEPKIEGLLQGYDFVFFLSTTPINSSETATLLKWVDMAVVVLDDEPLQTLTLCREWSRQKEQRRAMFVQLDTMRML